MSEKEAKAVKLLDTKLDKKVIKTLTVCTVIMLIAILIHDGDHIRQAYNWGYTIPLSLWALNLTVYVLPVVTLSSTGHILRIIAGSCRPWMLS